MRTEYWRCELGVRKGQGIRSKDKVAEARVATVTSKVAFLAAKKGCLSVVARPKLDQGHFMMNWAVVGSRYLCRRRRARD